MRRCVWTTTGLVVLCLAGTYMAAHRAVHYPDSFLGRCARGLASWAPVFGFSAAESTKADTPPAPAIAKPTPDLEQAQAIEPIMVERPWEESEPPMPFPPLLAEPAEIVLAEPVEISQAPRVMPLCPEDDDPTVRRMPYAEEEADLDFEIQLELPAGLIWEQVTEAQLIEIVRQDTLRRAMEGRSRSFFDWFWPWTEAPAAPAIVGPPAPLEESDLSELANEFREDPHRHHHYPSCPYTGRFSPPAYCPVPRLPLPPLPPLLPLPPPNSAEPEPR